MDRKNSWTCPEIFRLIGKKRLPGSDGLKYKLGNLSNIYAINKASNFETVEF
jgi:hypothetical protein